MRTFEATRLPSLWYNGLHMSTEMLEKRIDILEREISTLRAAVLSHAPKTFVKKLSRGLQAALQDAKAGRVSPPFRSVNALMKHLEK